MGLFQGSVFDTIFSANPFEMSFTPWGAFASRVTPARAWRFGRLMRAMLARKQRRDIERRRAESYHPRSCTWRSMLRCKH